MTRIVAFLIAVFMIFSFSACTFEKDFFEEEVLITSKNSPDGNYTLSLYQVGSPQWSFGSVNAKLVLEDSNGITIDEENFGLGNDGADVSVNNIESIIWMENQVEILIIEFDTTQKFTFVLNYTKEK